MSRFRQIITVALCAAATASAIIPAFVHADTAEQKPAATQKAGRDIDAINKDLVAAGVKFKAIVPSVMNLGDPKFRKDNAEKAIPALKTIASLLDEIATTFGDASAADGRNHFLAMEVAMGDQDAVKSLTDYGYSKDAEEAASAKSALAFGRWVQNSDDAKAQAKVLDDYAALAKADPKEDKYAETLMQMTELGAANEELAKKARLVIIDSLKGDLAQQIIAQTAALDHPITLSGRTTTDGKFSSASLKGKVILVDFWGTWCPACVAQMPELKKLYTTYHEKGLEIIGVDSDASDEKPNAFVKQNEIPWMQLREQSQTEMDYTHPINVKYDLEIYPTTFLIDRKGVLRYIENPEKPVDMEALVKKLLAEPEGKGKK